MYYIILFTNIIKCIILSEYNCNFKLDTTKNPNKLNYIYVNTSSFCLQVEFATNVFQLVTSFNSLSLTDTEVGLFAAIVLLTPDRPGVSDVKTVQHSQDRIVEAFKLQVSYNVRNNIIEGLGIRRAFPRKTCFEINGFKV